MSSDISLSLSNLLHSVGQCTMSICVAANCIILLFLMDENIPLNIYVAHLLYPFLCRRTFMLLPCVGYCRQCFSELWGICIFLDHIFLWIYVQGMGLHGHMVALFFVF